MPTTTPSPSRHLHSFPRSPASNALLLVFPPTPHTPSCSHNHYLSPTLLAPPPHWSPASFLPQGGQLTKAFIPNPGESRGLLSPCGLMNLGEMLPRPSLAHPPPRSKHNRRPSLMGERYWGCFSHMTPSSPVCLAVCLHLSLRPPLSLFHSQNPRCNL